MRSIDNLREYALTAASICSTTRAILVGYIDGIEREVADMVPLPLDADGVPIHVGDVMEWSDGETFEVVGIGDTGTLYYLETRDDGTVGIEWTSTECKRHNAPTVEDVLREFAQEMNENLGMYTGEAIDADEWRKADERTIAEFAARLRLAGEE